MKYWQNKEWLTEEYSKYGSSTIAKKCNVDDSTIIYWLKKFNIPIKSRRNSRLLSLNRYFVDRQYFKNIDSEKKAYWLGFIMADGCIREYRPNCYQFSFELAIKDKKIVQQLVEDIKYSGPIYYTSNKARLIITDYIFCKTLIEHNISTHKTGNEKYPDINKNLNKHFIRGYFDGDGSIQYKKHPKRIRVKLHIACANYNFLKTIKNIIEEETNIKFSNKSLHKHQKANAYEFECSSIKNILQVYKYFYIKSNIYMHRKYNIFQKIVNHSASSKYKILKDIVRTFTET